MMEASCVRVPREEGERVRRELAAADLVDQDAEIDVQDGWLYIPVIDPKAVSEEYDVVAHEVDSRETQTTPAELLGFEPSYERLGDIVIVDEDDPDRARAIADAIMASDLPVDTVVNKRSKVKGEERLRDWAVLAGDGTETIHREYGCSFALDILRVYFSPRLATERHRVVQQVRAGECAFDMFCGVGPFVVPMAKRGADCVGTDINEVAIEYLRENARRNGVAERVTAIQSDIRAVAPDYDGWADRVVMNLPHSADEFLDAAMVLAADECVLHYYDIQPEEDAFKAGEAAIRRAAREAGYDVSIETRRMVRSYAPGEVNVCLDARLSSRSGIGDRNP